MDRFTFYQYCGLGSGFTIVDNWEGVVPEKDLGRVARLMCRRHYGLGSEAAVFIMAGPDDVDFAWRGFGPDGAELDISVLGGLCAAHLANTVGIAPGEMSFRTKAGQVEAEVNGHEVRALLPKPGRFSGAALVEAEGVSLAYHRLSLGGPHGVALVDDLEGLKVGRVGRAVRHHPAFAPDGASIDFVKLLGPDKIATRTLAMGAEDESPACGDGAVAGVLLAASQKLVNPAAVTCLAKSGESLAVACEGAAPEAPDKITVTGAVRYLFSGQVENDLFTK